ncbi:SRPBCC family protein [Bradyrhizobium sp. 180]|uniref:SRPBCC family protein n=1 Tax=unclassified Bradyrhizobium TaxID=2631580 RepID=UPI001FFBAAE2|nr:MULTISPECIES: SRPBCC family protein [unclassified Bradyrhizobium]MCK1423869.1 SRPBCC family protein [Bradyrhizobium sp. CW12]MCK1495363.1 SRPBCC family protein [Bradyrhizobium sp. 180]MCK1526397.1 SRPBCC family protein [Bradyrhizobium sp. 182]MCK1597521.1 SRPBCC family protein [Bradyrhizobium sp. 164]MCK1616278.1 SRPBCC family protein [Bradyrhizobium sp. 159]
MLKAIAVIAIVLAAGIAAVLVFALTKPDTFRVERTLTVKAPADAIYPQVADFHRWTAWSPYESRDPAMRRTFGGAAEGKGATYAWDGNNNVGAGHMEILEANAPLRLRIKLDFERPFEGHNSAEFTFVPQGDATLITWAMYGPAPFLSKLMQVFINMDSMIGKDFEVGLVSLKKLTEKQ